MTNSTNLKQEFWQEYFSAPCKTTIQGITGDNVYGPVVFEGGQVAYLNAGETVWHELNLAAPFEIKGITGDNSTGPIIYNGKNVAYFKWGHQSWTKLWKDEPEGLAPFEIKGITGDNYWGVVAFNGKHVFYFKWGHQSWTKLWKDEPEGLAPFEIKGITGDNATGPIIYNKKKVSYFRWGTHTWQSLSEAPFDIDGITGNNVGGGVIVYNSEKNLVAYMNSCAENIWHELPAPSEGIFKIQGIAGDIANGAIAYSGKRVAYAPTTDSEKLPQVKILYINATNQDPASLVHDGSLKQTEWANYVLKKSAANFELVQVGPTYDWDKSWGPRPDATHAVEESLDIVKLQGIQEVRKRYGANVVCLVISQGGADNGCAAIGSYKNGDVPRMVCRIGAFLGEMEMWWLVVHELGHILGAEHKDGVLATMGLPGVSIQYRTLMKKDFSKVARPLFSDATMKKVNAHWKELAENY